VATPADQDGNNSVHQSARAPVEGPAEVAKAAEIFNRLIGERQAHEAELTWKATHDDLTGLPNRHAVTREVAALLGSGRGDDLAVLFLNLDRFKLVNDSHGHVVGDKALIAIGARLAAALGRAGTMARFGSDDFVAVCPGIGGEEGAVATANRLLDALRQPLRVDALEIWPSGTVGIALAHPSEGVDDLFRNADTAMSGARRRTTPAAATSTTGGCGSGRCSGSSSSTT
jgi:diguanylate cyclase (GGDEF)-like protein